MSIGTFNLSNGFMENVLSATENPEIKKRMALFIVRVKIKKLNQELNELPGKLFSFHRDIIRIQIDELDKIINGDFDIEAIQNQIGIIGKSFDNFRTIKDKLKAASLYESSKEIIESLDLSNLPIEVSLDMCYEMLDLELSLIHI